MKRLRIPRFVAWLALAAMALNAFWPLIASAKPAQAEAAAEICSASGLTHEGLPADLPDQNPLFLHCALCVFHAGVGVAITTTIRVLSEPATAAVEFPAFVAEPRLAAAFDPAAPPRAPPFPA